MPTTVRLSDHLVQDAKTLAAVQKRSVPKQIEYYYMLGKMSEDNPDLPMSFIKDALEAQAEIANGQVTPFVFED